MDYYLSVFILWIFFSVISAVIANNKGRSGFGVFLISIFLTPLMGIIIALVISVNVKEVEKNLLTKGIVKKCPSCAEIVKKEALVCRYCGKDLNIQTGVILTKKPERIYKAETFPKQPEIIYTVEAPQKNMRMIVGVSIILISLVTLSILRMDRSITGNYVVQYGGQYIDNGDGTIKDNKTGLTWMRCLVGQVWDGNHCSGHAQTFTFDQAAKQTTIYARHYNWRTPTIEELSSLLYCSSNQPSTYPFAGKNETSGCEGEYQKPTINIVAFPDKTPHVIWSSSSYDSENSWYVTFGYGTPAHGVNYSNYGVRLVRDK